MGLRRGSVIEVPRIERMWHSDEKRQSKTERRLPHHLYISLKPIKLWNWIHGCGERQRVLHWKSGRRLFKLGKELRRKMTKYFSLSVTFALWMASAQRSAAANSDAESKVERERQGESRGKTENGKGMNDSKEEKSDRTGREVPASHCFTSHCTEGENLSYASAFHIAFTIYVPARIMQLDGSVEKTPINLILFSIFFFSLSFSFSAPLIRSVSVLCRSSALVYFLTSYVKVFSSKPLSHVHTVFCWARKCEMQNLHTHAHTLTICVFLIQQANNQPAHRDLDRFLLKWKEKWLY